MLSPSRIKQELFSSDDDGMEDDGEESSQGTSTRAGKEEKIELLQFERNLMLDTFTDDVLFVLARGLGLERLILHHIHLYSDPKLLVFVINTGRHDEAYLLSRLRSAKHAPKVVNTDVSIKDRESLYMEGGVQFITSRILMVDLLQERVPVKKVAGIIVLRAHQLLSSYQESFILRLYRERKADGFVKAFSDNPSAFSSLGVLQRLVNRLYVRRVRLVPRFDVDVKRVLDANPPKLIELNVDLPHPMRRVQSSLVDIIRTCVNELKMTSTSSVDNTIEEESSHPSAGLTATMLEMQLNGRNFSLTDKQQRLITDLKRLRSFLYQAEQLDPTILYQSLVDIRANKDEVTQNSGWLFTQTSAKLFADAEGMCKVKVDNDFTLLVPPKWSALKTALAEIHDEFKGKKKAKCDANQKEDAVLLITAGPEVCVQLRQLVKKGPKLLAWIQRNAVISQLSSARTVSSEPDPEPLWDPSRIVLFASNLEGGETRSDILNGIKANQKLAVREGRKRRKLAEAEKKKRIKTLGKVDENQTRLVQFGIVQYKRRLSDKPVVDVVEAGPSEESKTDDGEAPEAEEVEEGSDEESHEDPLLIIFPQGERYNLIRQLERFSPSHVILYHSDLVTLRLLEMYQACSPVGSEQLRIYVIMHTQSNEEERYLCMLRREQLAFEQLIREQGTLMSAREFDTSRETPRQLKPAPRSSRNAGGRPLDDEETNEPPKVIVDMREFNSELPTVLYKRGIDLVPATLEVGDYILSPDIAVERKALDDLTQSLNSGRVFKQIEQMLRHYKKVILLVEGNARDDFRKINGGPFQGELSRRCRETRSLFALLIRTYPAMNVVWTLEPMKSVEMFEEFKLNEPNPDLERAVSIKSDADESVEHGDSQPASVDEGSNHGAGNRDADGSQPSGSGSAGGSASSASNDPPPVAKPKRLNSVLQRQLSKVPTLAAGDLTKMMRSQQVRCLLDVVNADVEKVRAIFDNNTLADSTRGFFNMDFRLT